MLKKLFSLFGISRGVMTLLTGNIIAQAAPLIATPILTRLYSPAEFGIFSLFAAVVAIIGVAATARFELAIMLPEDDHDAVNIIFLSLSIAIALSLITLIPIIFFNHQIANVFHHPELAPYLFWIPPAIFLTGCFQVFTYWTSRKRKYKLLSAGNVTQGVSYCSSAVALGFASFGAEGLIFSSVLSQFLSSAAIGIPSYFEIKSSLKEINQSRIKKNYSQHKNFALYNTPHALLDSFQNNGIIFIITYYFSSAIIGLYAFTFRVLKAPVNLFGSAMYQVFYQRVTKEFHSGENLQKLITDMYKRLALIGFPFFFTLFFFTPQIFSMVFGSKWYDAGVIGQILIPWIFLNFLASPVSCITLVVGKQKAAFLITIVDFSLRLIALFVGGYFHNYKLAFILLSLSCSLIQIYILIWYYKIAGIKKSNAEV
jgi:lipopolysaccharide exporter